MSLNVSSATNGSLQTPDDVSSSCSSILSYMVCLRSYPAYVFYTIFKSIRTMHMLPLSISILHHGFQQWKQRRSTSSASASHSDYFTYNMMIMELIVVVGYILSFVGIYSGNSFMLYLSILILLFVWYGEMCFHVLTCLERYLAVVHPITYMILRKERGIRIRNIIVGCVWLLCFVGMGLLPIDGFEKVFSYFLLIFSLMMSLFCSLSVLCVLIRPGPGKQGENRERVDPSKMRAFHTLLVILTVLFIRFVWDVFWLELFTGSKNSDCVIKMFGFWFNLPSSLVLPLLFLHRVGKLVCPKIPCLNKG